MLPELTFDRVDVQESRFWGVYPGPSSQTMSSWPLLLSLGDERRIISDTVNLDGGNLFIYPPREKTWDEVVEEVLHARAELWNRLADL